MGKRNLKINKGKKDGKYEINYIEVVKSIYFNKQIIKIKQLNN